ncbi:MAG: Sensor protein DegS [Hydrogenibacillus schlegelii]|uniref:histidine kinase n=2 Tax=Hydrogenibacillus schlegelii TaxID=1484 RepID=A0A2T5GCA8_HYDSH|nr:MAG: Sensor protein DegS [Hydrogenibacillus schlegelii]
MIAFMDRWSENGAQSASRALDRVLRRAIETMEMSRDQIYEIAEHAREEYEALKKELDAVREDVRRHIEQNDALEREVKKMRRRLMEVSRHFHRYREPDIREAYEAAHRAQMALTLNREKEIFLRKRRDELELRLKNLERTLEKADRLLAQVSVVLSYLQGDIARMTEALASAESGQLFGLKIIEAQEEERRRVAREMHDGPAQSLAHVILRLEIIERTLDGGDLDAVRAELLALRESVRRSLADVRRIIYDLRPMALDDLGLVPVVKRLVEEYNEKYPFYIEFQVHGREERLKPMIEVALFRMIQEALNNVVKHAEATLVQIVLEFLPLKVRLRIKDNGKGFDLEALKDRPTFGLMGIRERVKLLRGEIDIQTRPGAGTDLRIEVPIYDQGTGTAKGPEDKTERDDG